MKKKAYVGCDCVLGVGPYCGEYSPDHAYFCTRKEGHNGYHRACKYHNTEPIHGVLTWGNKKKPTELKPCPICKSEVVDKGNGISCPLCGLWFSPWSSSSRNYIEYWNSRCEPDLPGCPDCKTNYRVSYTCSDCGKDFSQSY